MTLSDVEMRKLEGTLAAFVEQSRRTPHSRSTGAFSFGIAGQSVELRVLRPQPDGSCREQPVAKATFVRALEAWRVYWRTADLKWDSYPEAPKVRTIERFLDLVEEDLHGRFSTQ